MPLGGGLEKVDEKNIQIRRWPHPYGMVWDARIESAASYAHTVGPIVRMYGAL